MPCFQPRHTSLLFSFILSSIIAVSQQRDTVIPKKQYFTNRLNGVITLDGIPNEEVWNAVDWGVDFVQYTPNGGKPPYQQSAFKILYDDRFLYVAVRCFDSSPDSIVKRMGRRDDFPGDDIEILIDSYHDLRTVFGFCVSASGVRGDEFGSNDGNNWNANWNPIWFAKTHIDEKGWTAEMKIPLSQLRYDNTPEKVWGLQIFRHMFRKDERSTWQYIPQNSGVWVSRFGELRGLKNIPMHRQVEIAPYIIAEADKYKKETGNPFSTGLDRKFSGGIDGKLAVTNDLILDFTINPDFGQVEADPSAVRIDGFQTFFEERRPFFIEGRNIYDYQLTGSQAGGDYDADLLFYSRRIGSSPHGAPNLSNGEYAKLRSNTPIIGAAKFSGKTKDGWSVGVLESLTDRVWATIDNNGFKRKELEEPLTNYFVGRLQKDMDSANTILGGIITGVNRENKMTDALTRNAYSGGFDFLHYWKKKTWYVLGNVVFSHLQGTKESILRTQTAFEHLFQRPGAKEISLDSNRTSLTGTGGTVRFGKSGGKQGKLGQLFMFETGLTFRSPSLELNDIGFMLAADEINHFTWAGLVYQKPFSIFRTARMNYNHWLKWDFAGKLLWLAYNVNGHATFRNNLRTGTGFTWNPYEISNNALRGGSSMRRPAGIDNFYYLQTDIRKKLQFIFQMNNAIGFANTVKANNFNLVASYQPTNAFQFSLGAGYSYYWRRQDQFVANIPFNNINRTIVGEVSQKTFQFTGRLTYNITPDLTLQYYGQPFITRPLYNHFAYVSSPFAKAYSDRFTIFSPSQITYNNGEYFVDENNRGATDYTFSRPDFNFVQFRSNFVVRWEYRPGSEMYFVWSQSNTPDVSSDLDSPVLRNLFENAFTTQPRNIFLVKCTYRFLR